MGRRMKIDIEQYDPILPDESILAVGIDRIDFTNAIGVFKVIGKYDYLGIVGDYEFYFHNDWQYSSIKELEEFIQNKLQEEFANSCLARRMEFVVIADPRMEATVKGIEYMIKRYGVSGDSI